MVAVNLLFGATHCTMSETGCPVAGSQRNGDPMWAVSWASCQGREGTRGRARLGHCTAFLARIQVYCLGQECLHCRDLF